MVVTPLLQLGYSVALPRSEDSVSTPMEQIVVQVASDGSIFLSRQPMTLETLASQLSEILRNRSQKAVFFVSDDSTEYGKALRALDVVRSAGATPIGIGLEDSKR